MTHKSRWPALPARHGGKLTLPLALLLAAAIPLSGCANRRANPVAVEQPHDKMLSCGQLSSEISAAQRLIGSYGVDQQQQQQRNGAAAVGAVLAPMALINMDTGTAAAQEVEAYSQRIAHLEDLSKQKACS